MFPCEFCEISKSTFSYRTPLVAASKSMLLVKQIGDKSVKPVCKSTKILVTYTKVSVFLPTKSEQVIQFFSTNFFRKVVTFSWLNLVEI